MFSLFVVLASVLASAVLVAAAHDNPSLKDACISWNRWKISLQGDPNVRLKCDINTYCTGIKCSGKYQDFDVSLELLMRHCADPVGVDLRLSVPQLSIRNWNHTFVHGERFPLPTTEGAGGLPVNGTVEVFLQQKDEETVIFGCSVLEQRQQQRRQGSSAAEAAVSILPIRNQSIKLPKCSPKSHGAREPPPVVVVGKQQRSAYKKSEEERPALLRNAISTQESVGNPCDLDALGGCGRNEMCDEVRRSDPPRGACICRPDFHWDADRVCAPIVPSSSSSSSSGGDATGGSGSRPVSNPASMMTAVQIAVPLVLIAATAVLVVLAYKFRWVSRLRARLRRGRGGPTAHVYEEMVIDGDEVSSVHSLTTDPVV